MSANLEIKAFATNGDLLICLEKIGHFGAAGNLDRRLIAKVRIVIEELFSNTIKYGYPAGGGGEVRISLAPGPTFTVRYEDDAPPFDPTAWKRASRRATRVGQAGLDMVLALAASIAYERLQRGNRLVLTFVPD